MNIIKKLKLSNKIYGIGNKSLNKLYNSHGIGKGYVRNNIEELQKYFISNNIKDNNIVEDSLKKTIHHNISRLIELKTIRGYRHKKGYPVRGQRTRSNAKTQAKIFRIRLKN